MSDDEELYTPRPPVSGEIHSPRVRTSSPDISGGGAPYANVPFGQSPVPPAGRMLSLGSATRAGVGMGSALAIAISWSQHASIVWAVIHGFLSWLYVAWFAVTR